MSETSCNSAALLTYIPLPGNAFILGMTMLHHNLHFITLYVLSPCVIAYIYNANIASILQRTP